MNKAMEKAIVGPDQKAGVIHRRRWSIAGGRFNIVLTRSIERLPNRAHLKAAVRGCIANRKTAFSANQATEL